MSTHAAEMERVDSDISVESWLFEGGRDLPVLSFGKQYKKEDLADDIRVENVVRDENGSVHFQLTANGPMSRQVFANVRRVEQDDGYTRSIITNIADGQQMEYLTRTSEVAAINQTDKENTAGLLAESGFIDDQHVECPWCYYVGWLLSEAACASAATLTHYQCRLSCRDRGGIKRFNTGICGLVNAECVCWIQPRKESRVF